MAVAINTCRNLLESGYTMAVSAACSNDIDACLKMSIEEGLIAGPRLLACSPHLETTGNERPDWWYDIRNTGMQVFVDGPERCARRFTQIRRGADWIKILPTGRPRHHRASLPSHQQRTRSWQRCRRRTISARSGPRAMARADCRVRRSGGRPDDHGDEIDEPIIEAMVEPGTSGCPACASSTSRSVSGEGLVPSGGLERK